MQCFSLLYAASCSYFRLHSRCIYLFEDYLYQCLEFICSHIGTLSLIASAIVIKNYRLPLTICIICFWQSLPILCLACQNLGQWHMFLAGELKGLSDCISFLLHTCVTFFFCMVLACVRAHVKLQSRAIWPMLWHLRHSTLYMNKNSWFLLAKLFLGGCRRL